MATVERALSLAGPHADAGRGSRRIAPCSSYISMLLLLLALLVVGITTVAYISGATAYIDNGDGYYLYVANRVARGAVLYRDVMGTQPPLVYLLGALAFKLGASLQGMRLLSGLMRAATTVLVYTLGGRLCGERLVGALAALIYSILPIGLSWDRSFDVNPPLTLIALLAALPLARLTPRAVLLSGLLAALALYTKNLYTPLLVATLIYLALQQRRLLAPYLQGLFAGLVTLGLALVVYAGPAGLRDAFLGQESSSLNPTWLMWSLLYVVGMDGGVILVALAGVALSRYATRPRAATRYAPWFLAGVSGVLLATLKEGTAGPVFQLAEPAVALLAAYAAVWAVRRLKSPRAIGILAPALVLVLAWSCIMAAGADRAALAQNNAGEVARIVALVQSQVPTGAAILAPPYYALLTDTRLPDDMADTYIVAQRVRRGDRPAWSWLHRIVGDISARRLPVILIDLRLAAITPLLAAVRAHYHPIYSDALPPALHVVVWAPMGPRRGVSARGPHATGWPRGRRRQSEAAATRP